MTPDRPGALPPTALTQSGARDEPLPGLATGASAPPRRWCSLALFGREQQIEIAHGQTIYRLRKTALGKLILTK